MLRFSFTQLINFCNWYFEFIGTVLNRCVGAVRAASGACSFVCRAADNLFVNENQKCRAETERCAWTPGSKNARHHPSEKHSLSSFCWDSTCWWGAAAPAGFCLPPSLLLQVCLFWWLNFSHMSVSYNRKWPLFHPLRPKSSIEVFVMTCSGITEKNKMCFSVCGEGRRQRSAAEMAAREHRLPGGDAAGEPGEGVHRGGLRLRGGSGGFRRRWLHGEKLHWWPNF